VRSGTTGFALTTEWIAFPYTREPKALLGQVEFKGRTVEVHNVFANGTVEHMTHFAQISCGRNFHIRATYGLV
jgi:hypothetical protein